MYLLPPMWCLFINFGDPLPLPWWSHFWMVPSAIFDSPKNVYLKSMVYSFSRKFLNFFQGLNYQNDHFYTGCLDLLNSFFAFHSLKYLLFHVLFAVFHVLFSLFWGCNLFWIALRRALLIWGFRLPQNVLISFGVCLLSVFIIFFSWNLSNPYSLWLRKFYTYSQVG